MFFGNGYTMSYFICPLTNIITGESLTDTVLVFMVAQWIFAHYKEEEFIILDALFIILEQKHYRE